MSDAYKRNYTPPKNNNNNLNTRGNPKANIENFMQNIKNDWKYIRVYVVVYILLSTFLSGLLVQSVKSALSGRRISFFGCFASGIFSGGLFINLILIGAGIYYGLKIYRRVKTSYYEDSEGDIVDNSNVYGGNHFQTIEEQKENFLMADNPLDIPGDILGINEEGKLLSLDFSKIYGANNHKAVIGKSGAGKSECLVYNMIYQRINMGMSMVVTDTKGDVYRRTCAIALKKGYIVRVLNLKSKELKNSDGVDFMKYLHGDDAMAEVLANTIIMNSGDGKLDYFAVNEMNLLKALLIYVSNQSILIEQGRSNLAEVYRLCSHNDAEQLHIMFNSLDEDDPAREAFNIFYQCKPDVRGQIINGMAIRLAKLSNKYIRQIVSNDEIDFTLPYWKKCLYYVIIPDGTNAYRFISSLFFQEMLMIQTEYADAMTEDQKEKRKHISYIMDEYKNTGGFVDPDNVISTVRSRDIDITYIIQDIGQLETLYEPSVAKTFLNNTTIKILLNTTDPDTAEYFSGLLGDKTAVVNNVAVNGDGSMVDGSADRTTYGLGKKPVMSPADIMNKLSEDDLIVHINPRMPVKLQKFLSFNHPYHKDVVDMIPSRHLPLWRKRQMEEEEEVRQYMQQQENQNAASKQNDAPEAPQEKMTLEEMRRQAALAAASQLQSIRNPIQSAAERTDNINDARLAQTGRKESLKNEQIRVSNEDINAKKRENIDKIRRRAEAVEEEEYLKHKEEEKRQREKDVQEAKKAVAKANAKASRMNEIMAEMNEAIISEGQKETEAECQKAEIEDNPLDYPDELEACMDIPDMDDIPEIPGMEEINASAYEDILTDDIDYPQIQVDDDLMDTAMDVPDDKEEEMTKMESEQRPEQDKRKISSFMDLTEDVEDNSSIKDAMSPSSQSRKKKPSMHEKNRMDMERVSGKANRADSALDNLFR